MEADEQLRGDRTRRGERVWSGIRHGKDHLRLLPPSANWYCAKVAGGGGGGEDSSSGGDAVKLSFFAQLVRGKRDRRVTAVQFLTDTTGELRLVCGGEEGSVQIWWVGDNTAECDGVLIGVGGDGGLAEVMAVTVSGLLDANFVVAGDRQGRISAWERDAGVLCLVDAAQGTVRYRLAGHDQEVQCVAWKATDKSNHSVAEDEEGAESGSAERDVWLASSSRDKTIKLWKLASDSAEEPVLEQLLRLPTGKQGMSFTQTKQLWLPVAWSVNDNDRLGRHCLWSGSFDGSLLRWEWSAGKSEGQGKKGKKRVPCKPVAFKGGHNRMLFSIVMTPPRGTTLPEDGAASMLTVSLDRELRIWRENPSSKSSPAATCVEKLTGLGGHGSDDPAVEFGCRCCLSAK
ncbi:hypothetical protein ON010_g17885 [Phytophthora cinnamomi]|nr:hypothetical protein ON010_g17885 [Phytophthora cinnamomi]